MSFKLVANGIFQEGGNLPYPEVMLTLGDCCQLLFLPCFVKVNLGIVVY